MNRRTAVTIVSAVVATSVALTGCEAGSGKTTYYKNGPAGLVVEHEIDDGHYEIDTKDFKGKKHEFNVTGSVYNDCQMYSRYPSCVKHSKSWKSKKKSSKINKSYKTPKKTSKKFSFKKSKKR